MRLQETHTHDQGPVRQSCDRAQATPSLATRDAEWLHEMKSKMAAVEAWRGFPTHHRRKQAAS